jgi:AraC family transcriptional regulator, transcriptional activator FtrA
MSRPGWIREVVDGVERVFRTLPIVARQVHMSPRTLERRFRAETGESLQAWISRQRVERARALLEETDLTITNVAHASGFGSTQAMRRHFLLHTGASPRDYRAAFRAPLPV